MGPHSFLIENGVVTSITAGTGSFDVTIPAINARGLTILPAGVDAQVHMRVPGQHHKETADSCTVAAIHGGVGAMLTMPNTKPVIDEPSIVIEAARELNKAHSRCGVQSFISAAITKGQRGRDLVDFDSLFRAGAIAFTDDGVGVSDDEVMKSALRATARLGLPILQHAECAGHGCVLAEGPLQQKIGLAPYLEDMETNMVARDIRLLSETPNARYHVLHVSSAKTLDLVAEAKKRGLKVTCEVSPHHLFFTSADIASDGSSFKMNPPLRQPRDRLALQNALQSGLCDFMATDHAPHESEAKTTNFKTSAFGTTGLETSLRVLIWLYQQKKLSPSRLVQVWAESPARFLGLGSGFGTIQLGQPFRATIADMNATDRYFLRSDLLGLSKNSCFINHRLPGRVHYTLLEHHIHEIL